MLANANTIAIYMHTIAISFQSVFWSSGTGISFISIHSYEHFVDLLPHSVECRATIFVPIAGDQQGTDGVKPPPMVVPEIINMTSIPNGTAFATTVKLWTAASFGVDNKKFQEEQTHRMDSLIAKGMQNRLVAMKEIELRCRENDGPPQMLKKFFLGPFD